MRGSVIIFVKAPRAGAVKTRLGAEIGMGRAAALFRIMTERTIAEAVKGDWRTCLAVDPPSAVTGWDSLWPPRLSRMAQAPGDLGARMAHAFNAAPPGPTLIIGADAPGLRARHLRQAFKALGRADAVFGPAEDGGYWLIGLARRRPAPNLFEGVRWSTKHALADTVKTLPGGFQVSHLETLADIDEARDLKQFGLCATAH
ncbi:MAG: glycosyltransferase [Alphaproteobacteria bacterium]|nr:glycosyltransferase [Alphaproteobacteria bacterium]